MTSQLRLAATHESAHIVAAMACGFEVSKVAIDRDGGGYMDVRFGPNDTVAEIENELLVTMAGRFAEHHLCGTSLESENSRSDRRKEAKLISKLAAKTNLLDADLRALACERRARDFVFAKRKAVECLAETLMMREARYDSSADFMA